MYEMILRFLDKGMLVEVGVLDHYWVRITVDQLASRKATVITTEGLARIAEAVEKFCGKEESDGSQI